MARPKRIKKREEGDRAECKERIPGSLTLELFANDLYYGDQCCISIVDKDTNEIFQTTLTELEQLITDFKKVRGIKRVRRTKR